MGKRESRKVDIDPYEVLGVARDADEAEIRDAYRSAAKEAHPDVEGGSRETFALVALAKDVLSDAKRRAKFDRTGVVDEADAQVDNLDATAHELIADVLEAVIQSQDDDFFRRDLVALIIEQIAAELEATLEVLTEHRRRLKRIEKLARKFKRKRGKAHVNMITRMLQSKARDVQASLVAAQDIEKRQKRAIELVRDYDFEADAPASPAQQAFERAIKERLNVWGG